jgi:hypothetical protein
VTPGPVDEEDTVGGVAAVGEAGGCCKVTLEVQENNMIARGLYARAGFSQAVYGAPVGGCLFYTKPLY